MLWQNYPTELDNYPLENAYAHTFSDVHTILPFWVRLLEDSRSPLPFPGQIDLYRHDCLHLLLKRAFSGNDEAYVVGFTLGNDPNTKPWHCYCFKLIAWLLYPPPYRFNREAFWHFDRGVEDGKRVPVQSLNRSPVQDWQTIPVQQLRKMLELEYQV
jgi:hypothetical protein